MHSLSPLLFLSLGTFPCEGHLVELGEGKAFSVSDVSPHSLMSKGEDLDASLPGRQPPHLPYPVLLPFSSILGTTLAQSLLDLAPLSP